MAPRCGQSMPTPRLFVRVRGVVDGVEALAAIAHPDRFDLPEELAVESGDGRDLDPLNLLSLPRGLDRLRDGTLAHTVPVEEVGVHARVQAGRVEEHQLAELPLADDAVFDELVRLLDRLGHVGHVPVRDVGAEDRPQPRARGLTRSANAHATSRSSASQPK